MHWLHHGTAWLCHAVKQASSAHRQRVALMVEEPTRCKLRDPLERLEARIWLLRAATPNTLGGALTGSFSTATLTRWRLNRISSRGMLPGSRSFFARRRSKARWRSNSCGRQRVCVVHVSAHAVESRRHGCDAGDVHAPSCTQRCVAACPPPPAPSREALSVEWVGTWLGRHVQMSLRVALHCARNPHALGHCRSTPSAVSSRLSTPACVTSPHARPGGSLHDDVTWHARTHMAHPHTHQHITKARRCVRSVRIPVHPMLAAGRVSARVACLPSPSLFAARAGSALSATSPLEPAGVARCHVHKQ